MGLRSELKSAIQQAASQGQLNLKDKRAVVGFIRDYATDYRGLKQSAATTQGLVDQGISPTVYGSPDALRSAQDEYAISRAPTPYEGLRSMPSPGALDIRAPEPQPQVGSGYDYFAMLQGGPTGNIQPPADNPALKMTYAAGAGLRPPTDQEAVASGRAPALAALQDEARQLYEWSKSNPAKASAAIATMEAGGNMSFGGSDMAQLAWAGRSPEEMRTLKAAMVQGVSEGGGIMSKDVIPGVIGVAGYAPTLIGGGGVARALAQGALPTVGQRALGLGIAGMAQDIATPISREQVGGPESTEDPLFRAARGFTGGASAVAGTGLARALPGAKPFATMLAGDVAASAGQAAAFAPEGERGRAAISGGLFGLLASAAGAKGEKAYLDDLAAQQAADAVNQRVEGMTRGLPAPPEQKLLPERAESITPEMQAQMDRAYVLQQEAQQRPIPMPGPVQEPPFTRVPPPEMQANAPRQPLLTAEEFAQFRRIEEARAAAEQARARSGMAPINPETLGLPPIPRTPEVLPIGGTGEPPIGPRRAPEGYMPQPQDVAPPVVRTPKRPVAPKPQAPVAPEPPKAQPVVADPIPAIATELRDLTALEDMTKESAVAMMRKHGATRDQFVEALKQEFDRRTAGPIPRQPKATLEPETRPVAVEQKPVAAAPEVSPQSVVGETKPPAPSKAKKIPDLRKLSDEDWLEAVNKMQDEERAEKAKTRLPAAQRKNPIYHDRAEEDVLLNQFLAIKDAERRIAAIQKRADDPSNYGREAEDQRQLSIARSEIERANIRIRDHIAEFDYSEADVEYVKQMADRWTPNPRLVRYAMDEEAPNKPKKPSSPKGNRGLREEPTDPRTLESQQPKEMFSGPIGMVPKSVRDAADKSMLGIWKDVKQGATLDPRKKAAMQRDLYNRFEDFKDKTSTTLGKIGFSPKALEALGLRHPMKAVRDLQKLRQDLVFDYARRGITEFEVGVAKMKPEQVEKIHELAEGYKPGWDEKSDEILRNFHQIVQENAKAIVDLGSPKTVAEAERIQKAEGLKFRPFTSEEMAQKFSEYQKPGQQGYVTHIRAVAESSVAGMMDARRLAKMRARLEKPMEPGKRADLKARIAALEKKMQGHEAAAPIKNADDLARRFSTDRPGLEREATKASAIYEARTKARKQMTFAEMKAEGYVVGKDAMSATMLGEGQLAITLKVMEQAAKNPELKPFIADIPNDADPAKPPKGWSLAKGAGWGPLRGKWLRDDVFVSLEPMTDFKKNGAWEIAQAITAATRSAAVLTSPKFHAITNPITGTLTAMQTVPLHKMPKAMFGADGSAAKIARFMSKGEAHPHIKELMADGQFRKVIDLADALEEHVAAHAKDFRDLEGGASYLKDFLDRAIENAKIRASNAMESRVGGNESTTQVANRFLYGAAQVIRWSTETLSGFDPLKAIGIDTSKLPEGLRAKFSVEGLGDLSALQDDFFRLTVYSHLRDMGLTAKEALGITADWFDVRRIPPIVRVATRVMVLGPTFGHWGWMYFRNMFLKRYALATPLKALALLAPVYVITEATKKLYGLSDDELDEMKKKAGIVPGSADDMGMAAIPGPDGKPAFLDIGTISALQAMTDSVPLLNMNHTDPGPDGQFARAFRAQARQNLLGTAFYKMFLGIDPRSGEHGRHATLADTLRLFPFLPGTSTARILGEMDRRETQKKYDPAKEGRDWADFVASAITGVRFPDGSTRYADKRQKEMELYEQGARGFTIPESPKKVKFRRSSRPPQMPKMKKP